MREFGVYSSQSCMAFFVDIAGLARFRSGGPCGATRAHHPLETSRSRHQKKAQNWYRHLDESGFLLMPSAGERGAPGASRRCRSLLYYNYRHDRSALAILTISPAQAGLCLCLSGQNFKAARGARPAEPAATSRRARSSFCRRGDVTGAGHPRGPPGPSRACKPNSFPVCSELNPVEQIWHHFRASAAGIRKTNMISESALHTPTPTGCAVPGQTAFPFILASKYRHHSTGNSRYIIFAKRNITSTALPRAASSPPPAS